MVNINLQNVMKHNLDASLKKSTAFKRVSFFSLGHDIFWFSFFFNFALDDSKVTGIFQVKKNLRSTFFSVSLQVMIIYDDSNGIFDWKKTHNFCNYLNELDFFDESNFFLVFDFFLFALEKKKDDFYRFAMNPFIELKKAPHRTY